MAVASAARAKKPSGPRLDPAYRPDTFGPKIKGRDPNLHYVLVNPNDPDTGLEYYLERGYEPVARGGSNARLAGAKDGQTNQTYRDQVLVAAPLAMIEAESAGARARADRIWKRLRSKKGADDFSRAGVRGQSGDEVVSVVEGDAERAED